MKNEFAFPISTATANHATGMTLRDYFAIHSVQPGIGELASMAGLFYRNGSIWKDEQVRVSGGEEWFNALPLSERLELFSRVKYAMADSMLKSRQIGEKE